MDSLQTRVLSYFLVTICLLFFLPFLFNLPPSILFWDYGGNDSISHKLAFGAIIFLTVVTCMILFYYDTDKYAEENDVNSYYDFIFTSTIIWMILCYVMRYKHWSSSRTWLWISLLLFIGASVCLILTCVYSVKLYNFVEKLTSDDSGGDIPYSKKAANGATKYLCLIYVIWVCTFHTGLWGYRRIRFNYGRYNQLFTSLRR